MNHSGSRADPRLIAERQRKAVRHAKKGMRTRLIAAKLGVNDRTVRRDLKAQGFSRHNGDDFSDMDICTVLIAKVAERRRMFGMTTAIGALRDRGMRVPRDRLRSMMHVCSIAGPPKESKKRLQWYETDKPLRVLSIDQNEYLARYRIMSFSAIDAYSRECVHHEVVTNLTGPSHTRFYANALRKARRLPGTTTADFAAAWRGAEYMIRCYHSGRNPSWTQDVGGHLLRRAAWQQIPSFRNTPVERRTLNNHHRMATFTAPLTLICVQSALDIP